MSKVDLLVSQRVFPNRSKTIQEALTDKLSLLRLSPEELAVIVSGLNEIVG